MCSNDPFTSNTAIQDINQSLVINNRYTVIKSLGSGGFGNVYLVEDTLFESTRVALKQVDEKIFSDTEVLRSFQNEFIALSKLKHPNLVQVYDFNFDQEHKSYYITMEYVEGTSLKGLRQSQGPFPVVKTIPLLVDICRVLSFIHSRGVIHRDINAANIMFSISNTVKLMDFGLADLEQVDLRSKGTIAFMAPEVLGGKADLRTDIFALGITLFELVADQPFHDPSNPQEIVYCLRDPNKYKQHLDSKLAQYTTSILHPILMRMLAYDPKNRFQNCTEIICDLNKAAGMEYAYETAATREAYVLGAKFVGRDQELDTLKQQATAPHATTLWVQGEPGVGKSRLFYEFKNWCQLQSMQFIEGTCYENMTRLFGPLLPILNTMLLYVSEEHVSRYGPELKKIVPQHPRLTNVEPAMVRDPQTDHAIIVKTIAQYMIEQVKSRAVPHVLYCNDLQWSDEGSLEVIDTMLKLIAENSTGIPFHLFLSSRIEHIEGLTAICDKRKIDVLKLTVFNEQIIQNYMGAIFGKDALGAQLLSTVPQIHEKVGGNPFFLQELIKSFIFAEAIVRTQTQWELVKSLDQAKIPKNLESLVIAHLNRLQLSGQNLLTLQIIALLNRPITWSDLNTIEPVSVDLLKLLESEEILKIKRFESHIAYEIAHDLIRDAISSTCTDRITIHEHIASSLERIHAHELDSCVEELARHYYTAQNKKKSLEYSKRALKVVMDNYENHKALDYADRILELLGDEDTKYKVNCLMDKGNILRICAKNNESIDIFKVAALDAERIGAMELLGDAYNYIGNTLSDMKYPLEQIMVYLDKALAVYESIQDKKGISDMYATLGYLRFQIEKEYDTAIILLNKGFTVAQELGNKRCMAYNLSAIAQVYEAQGEFQKAVECIKKVLHLFETTETKDKIYFMKRDIALNYGLMGSYYACSGNHASAIQWLTKQIEMSEQLGISPLYIFGLFRLADVWFSLKRFDEAKKLCDKARGCSKEIIDYESMFIGTVISARVEYAIGNKVAGIGMLKDLLKNAGDKYEIAKICYELWRMTRDEGYRTKSLELYHSITPKTKNWLYLKRQKELEENKPSVEVYAKQENAPSKYPTKLSEFRHFTN